MVVLSPSRRLENGQVHRTATSPRKGRPKTDRLAYWRSPRKESPRSRSARVASPLDLDFGREWLMRRDAGISRKMIDAERRTMAECLVSLKVFSPVDRPGLRRSENILEKAGLQYVGPIRGWKEQADKYARKRRDVDVHHDCGFSPAIIRFGDDIAGDASDASQRFVTAVAALATVLGKTVVHGIYVVRKVHEEVLSVPDGKVVGSWREMGKLSSKSRDLAEQRRARASAREWLTRPSASLPSAGRTEETGNTMRESQQAAGRKINNFLKRSEEALVAREERTRAKKKMQELIELAECTFQPRTAPDRGPDDQADEMWRRGLSSRRSMSRGQSVHERLYSKGLLDKGKREEIHRNARLTREREELAR
ncbi:hypothetical protein FOZ62_027949, partial [Perkinsus olseni]